MKKYQATSQVIYDICWACEGEGVLLGVFIQDCPNCGGSGVLESKEKKHV